MSRICVVTADSRTYFALATKLREAGFNFLSAFPGSSDVSCDVILTSRKEAALFRGAVASEDLDGDIDVFRGQVLSRLSSRREVLTIGIDPGVRIGLAVFLGETGVAFRTSDSRLDACERVKRLIDRVPSSKAVVRVGSGSPALGDWLVRQIAAQNPQAVVELVDESGTSVRDAKMKGLQKDQGAAARIALRKGNTPFRRDDQARIRRPRP